MIVDWKNGIFNLNYHAITAAIFLNDRIAFRALFCEFGEIFNV